MGRRQQPRRRPAPGWADREKLLIALCKGVGMSRAEAKAEVRKVTPPKT